MPIASSLPTEAPIAVVGGGLAGCECAWQLARCGRRVRLLEMRPTTTTPAHHSDQLAELVCSNSLRSEEPTMAVGLLKEEMRAAASLIMAAAEATRIPAGKALAVDRQRFANHITRAVTDHPAIELLRHEVTSLDDPMLSGAGAVVLAAGPLASAPLASELHRAVGQSELYFYDAIAPIVSADSVDMTQAYFGSRYRPEDDDYLNCPLDEAGYKDFVAALNAAEKVASREFERHFEGCLPIETMAARGEMTLAFGPMKPVGLPDPRTGQEPFAVVQLRAENRERTAYNLVGFQTKLTHPEQKRVFGRIPALARAEYLRLGSIHRNTYVNAPRVLSERLELRQRPGVYLAGQITGVEGYLESAACGLWLGLSLGLAGLGRELALPPVETALGALLGHLRTPTADFQPSNVHFGLMPGLNRRAGKKLRKELYAARGREAFAAWLAASDLPANA